jgi:hypothetical protein
MIPTLYKSACRMFDYMSPNENSDNYSNEIMGLYTINTIITRARATKIKPIFDALQNDICDEWMVSFVDLDTYHYDIDLNQKILSINTQGQSFDAFIMQSDVVKNKMLCTLIEGLRMVRHVEHVDHALELYNPESILKIGRYCLADTITQVISNAYQAKQMGYNGLWVSLLSGDHAFLAQEFSHFVGCDHNDETVIQNAMAHCFHLWFDDQTKRRKCDHDSLTLVDTLMDDDIVFGNQTIETTLVSCITITAGSTTSYIDEQYYEDIINNPYYVCIDDHINQAHLNQIMTDNCSMMVNGVLFSDPILATVFQSA